MIFIRRSTNNTPDLNMPKFKYKELSIRKQKQLLEIYDLNKLHNASLAKASCLLKITQGTLKKLLENRKSIEQVGGPSSTAGGLQQPSASALPAAPTRNGLANGFQQQRTNGMNGSIPQVSKTL